MREMTEEKMIVLRHDARGAISPLVRCLVGTSCFTPLYSFPRRKTNEASLTLSTTFTVLIPVLFVLLLGYFAWRIKAFDAEQVTGINELALDFALPASLFVGIVNIPRTQLVQDASLVVAVLVDMVGVYLVALIVGMVCYGALRETSVW
jgi:Membrane transport protein